MMTIADWLTAVEYMARLHNAHRYIEAVSPSVYWRKKAFAVIDAEWKKTLLIVEDGLKNGFSG